MADWERMLVSRVVREGNEAFKAAVDAGVGAKFFADDETREVWDLILSQYGEYGMVPTAKVVKSHYPTYRLLAVDEPLDLLIAELREKHRYALASIGLADASTALNARDVDGALAAFTRALQQVNHEVSGLRDIDLTRGIDDRVEYYLAPRPEGLRGLPTGFATIDAATLGLQPEQLITLVALPKTGKSIIALRIAREVHAAGGTPLFIGFEMSNDEQILRFDAMATGVAHSKLLRGDLTPSERGQLKRNLRELEGKHPFILSADASSTTTVSGVAAKIEQYQPSLVVLDGVYMMDDEQGEAKNSPQALTNITRSLKRTAQRLQVPLLITTQVLPSKMSRARGVQADSIGYSSSFAQDSDVILGLQPEWDEYGQAIPDTLRLRVVESRNCGRMEVLLRADWSSMEFEESAVQLEGEDEEREYEGRR